MGRRPPSVTLAPDMHRTPEISPTEIQIGELIGEGSFGKVYKGKCRGKDVAIKRLHKPIVDEKILNDFKREVHTMRYASCRRPLRAVCAASSIALPALICPACVLSSLP